MSLEISQGGQEKRPREEKGTDKKDGYNALMSPYNFEDLPEGPLEMIREYGLAEHLGNLNFSEQKKRCEAKKPMTLPDPAASYTLYDCTKEPLKTIHERTFIEEKTNTLAGRKEFFKNDSEKSKSKMIQKLTINVNEIEKDDVLFQLELPNLQSLTFFLNYENVTYKDVLRQKLWNTLSRFNYTSLKTLNISNNYLYEIPDLIQYFTSLTHLNLSSNGLTVFQVGIVKLTALTHLRLSNNNFRTRPSFYEPVVFQFPDNIGELAVLTRLDLSENYLKAPPINIEKITALTDLNLSENRLRIIQESFGDLVALTRLDVSHNELTTLPTSVQQLKSLTYLDISNNFFDESEKTAENLAGLTALTHLNLSRNHLKEVPQKIGELTALTHLNLSSNTLTQLPEEIGELTALTHLNLSSNTLTQLPKEIGKLTALTHLDVSVNTLTQLPEEIGKLTALTHLNVSVTKLTQLPESVSRIKYVRFEVIPPVIPPTRV